MTTTKSVWAGQLPPADAIDAAHIEMRQRRIAEEQTAADELWGRPPPRKKENFAPEGVAALMHCLKTGELPPEHPPDDPATAERKARQREWKARQRAKDRALANGLPWPPESPAEPRTPRPRYETSSNNRNQRY